MSAKILIADDEADIVSMLGSFFKSKGYDVLTAANGTDTLKQVEHNPDIILLDICMPDLDGLFAFVLYGKEGLDCSILFAPMSFGDGYIPFNITCGTLMKYQVLLAFTGTMSVAGITLLISAISKNQMVAVVASAAAYFFPMILPPSETNPLFRYIGLLPMYHAQFVSLMSIEQMSNGVFYAVWAIPAAFIFIGISIFASRRVFAKHQVS